MKEIKLNVFVLFYEICASLLLLSNTRTKLVLQIPFFASFILLYIFFVFVFCFFAIVSFGPAFSRFVSTQIEYIQSKAFNIQLHCE